MHQNTTGTPTGQLVVDRRRLVALMERRGIASFNDLAIQGRLSPNTITRLANGGSWTSTTLAIVARTLGCHPFDLLVAEGFTEPGLGQLGRPLRVIYE
jgi:hypothetical protein